MLVLLLSFLLTSTMARFGYYGYPYRSLSHVLLRAKGETDSDAQAMISNMSKRELRMEIKAFMKMLTKGQKKLDKIAKRCGLDEEDRRRSYGYYGLNYDKSSIPFVVRAESEAMGDKMDELKSMKLRKMKKRKLVKLLGDLQESAADMVKAKKRLKKRCAKGE